MVAAVGLGNVGTGERCLFDGGQKQASKQRRVILPKPAATEVYDGFAETNPKFKKIYEPWKAFRGEEILWFRVAEQNFDQFMATVSQQSPAPAKKG